MNDLFDKFEDYIENSDLLSYIYEAKNERCFGVARIAANDFHVQKYASISGIDYAQLRKDRKLTNILEYAKKYCKINNIKYAVTNGNIGVCSIRPSFEREYLHEHIFDCMNASEDIKANKFSCVERKILGKFFIDYTNGKKAVYYTDILTCYSQIKKINFFISKNDLCDDCKSFLKSAQLNNKCYLNNKKI